MGGEPALASLAAALRATVYLRMRAVSDGFIERVPYTSPDQGKPA